MIHFYSIRYSILTKGMRMRRFWFHKQNRSSWMIGLNVFGHHIVIFYY